MADELNAETFLPHEGTQFVVNPGAGTPSVLRLESVQRFAPRPGAPRPEPFSLLFTGPPEPVMPQRTYELRHLVLGRLEVFLVPLGPGPEGPMRYEAVFN